VTNPCAHAVSGYLSACALKGELFIHSLHPRPWNSYHHISFLAMIDLASWPYVQTKAKACLVPKAIRTAPLSKHTSKGIFRSSHLGFSPLYQLFPHPYLLYIILYINNHFISSLLCLFLSHLSVLHTRTVRLYRWRVTVANATVAYVLALRGAAHGSLYLPFSRRAVRTA
jgi:hypothetical protein